MNPRFCFVRVAQPPDTEVLRILRSRSVPDCWNFVIKCFELKPAWLGEFQQQFIQMLQPQRSWLEAVGIACEQTALLQPRNAGLQD